MNTLPSTLTASEARSNLYDMLDQVQNYLRRFVITHHGKPRAVILSLDEIESLEETADILAIPGARASILRGVAQVKKHQGKNFDKFTS